MIVVLNKFKKSIGLVESKYFGLDLLTESYSLENLVEEVKKENLGAHLGYLCEVFYNGTSELDIPNREKLFTIYKMLENTYQTWQYLHPNLPDFGKEILKSNEQTELNKKWKIYSNLTPSEIEDWVNLYIECQYLKKKNS